MPISKVAETLHSILPTLVGSATSNNYVDHQGLTDKYALRRILEWFPWNSGVVDSSFIRLAQIIVFPEE